MSKTYDAVTAVLVHEDELLVVRRQPFLSAFPGYHAFPGGKVDKTESTEAPAAELLAAMEPRVANALVRELQEELGWDLLAACEAGEVDSIQPLGIALTPPVFPVRFNTHFYRITLRQRPTVVADTNEVAEAYWTAAAALVERYEGGQLLCAPPTLETLRALSADIAASTVPKLHFEHRGEGELPMVEQVCGVRHIWVRSNTIPPAQHTNAYILGDMQSHRVLVDPAPADDAEMDRLIAMAQRYGVHEIFLTHHHHDHRERADVMARRMQIPVGMSEDTRHRIWDKTEGRFFEGIPTLNLYQDGDVLCRWLGQAVRVIAVPGHDEGQLALMPDNRAWCLVGDLIQGLGTVVIAKPEGHMGRYFDSLRKIIALKPQVILPSHGAALGTVHRLQETLKHREARELQILELHEQGKSVDEMLPMVYAGVDKFLWPLARMNIESHLDKLRDEGRLAA
ncbi:MAG TPA: MBL fold metallo-hydrolase [Solimonas sp.]|nr:MBL fold metallo-hydrolase [Solimonas sp.]